MSEWENRRLGDCVQMLSGGTPSKANDDYWNGDIPWVSAKDLKSFFLYDTQDHITQEAAQNGTKIAPEGSILILVRGMTLHNDLPIGCPTRDMAFNQDVKAMIADENLIRSKYLAYWLLANKPQLMELVESASHGTGRINTDDLKSIVISYPDLKEQEQISCLLGGLDRKIENLRGQNETLERIAQTLFKHWFVDFEFPNEDGKPYKSSGGAMERSELGEIPAGWHVGNLSDMGKIVCGKTPSKKQPDFYGGDIPFIKIPDMHNRVFVESTSEYLSIKGAKSQSKKIIPAYSINISCIATVGLVTINTKPSHTNQQINSIVPNQEEYLEFLFFHCKGLSETLRSIGSGGTATLNVNTGIFSRLTLVIPPSDVIAVFHDLSKSPFRKIEANSLHIQTLTKVRDVLLPKLMSGKLRITE